MATGDSSGSPSTGESSTGGKKSFWTSMPGILSGIAALITALVGVVGLVIATSGSDSDEKNSEKDNVSLEKWAQGASAICRELNDKSSKIEDPQTVEQVGPYLQQAEPLLSDAVARLRALPVPTGEEVRVERMIGLEERALDLFRGATSSFNSGDQTTATQLFLDAFEADDRFSELARELRAYDCAG